MTAGVSGMFSREEAVKLAKQVIEGWHGKQPQFKDVVLEWDHQSLSGKPFPEPIVRLLEDGVSRQVLLTHFHFKQDGPQTTHIFTCTVKDDPAKAQCDCK